MNIKHYKPQDRITSEQYEIDEDNCITISSSTLFNAGLSSDKEFVVLEKISSDNVYYIVPANFQYNDKEFLFISKSVIENGELKINVEGLFNLKAGDSVSLDVFEFQFMLYDRVTVIQNNDDEENDFWEEMRKKYSPKGMKNPFDIKDPYAPDENSIEMMRENLKKKFGNLADKCKHLQNSTDYNEWINNPPDFEELDKLFGNVLKELANHSIKQLHPSKDPLLNDFINDMLARVYGQEGKKVIMISNTELQEFIDDMTWWYNRIKKGK